MKVMRKFKKILRNYESDPSFFRGIKLAYWYVRVVEALGDDVSKREKFISDNNAFVMDTLSTEVRNFVPRKAAPSD